MSKVKQISSVMLVWAVFNTPGVNAENYVIKRGDALSLIAEKKRVQSGFLLNTEQIMLTLYKLNNSAFHNGNINQLVVSAPLYIPDNTSDYIQLSKTEAQSKLRDKRYLQSLLRSTHSEDAEMSTETVSSYPKGSADYSHVMQMLESHQKVIDGLKIDNVRLAQQYNLMERTLGRVVLVQGLLTNDMVQVRSKLANPAALTKPSETFENVGQFDSATANGDQVEMLAPASEISPLVELPAVASDTQQNNSTELKVENVEADGDAEKQTKSQSTEPSVSSNPETAEGVNKKSESSEKSPQVISIPTLQSVALDWIPIAQILSGITLALLAIWVGLAFYKKNRVTNEETLEDDEEDVNISSEEDNAPAFDINQFTKNTDLDESDVLVPVKTIIAKSQEAVKDEGPEAGLSSVLELLDMCLLCGDYQQAHTVILKAISEHKTSPILTKKLAFIERKMAKL